MTDFPTVNWKKKKRKEIKNFFLSGNSLIEWLGDWKIPNNEDTSGK